MKRMPKKYLAKVPNEFGETKASRQIIQKKFADLAKNKDTKDEDYFGYLDEQPINIRYIQINKRNRTLCQRVANLDVRMAQYFPESVMDAEMIEFLLEKDPTSIKYIGMKNMTRYMENKKTEGVKFLVGSTS